MLYVFRIEFLSWFPAAVFGSFRFSLCVHCFLFLARLFFGLRGRLGSAVFLIRSADRRGNPGEARRRGYSPKYFLKKKGVKNTQNYLTSKIAYDIVRTTAKTLSGTQNSRQVEEKKDG